MPITLRVESRPAWRLLLAATAALSLGDAVAMVLVHFGYNFRFLRLLDLDDERSVGTLYSVVLLIACATLLLVLTFVARRQAAHARHEAPWWLGLGALFVFMAADEALSLHEALMLPVREALHASGVLYFAWIIPYAGLVLVVTVLYVPFLLRLPREVAVRFVIAGAVYVSGAVGLEMVAGYLRSRGYHGQAIEQLVEETMEMLGAAYFLIALLRYIELGGQPLQLIVPMPDATAPRRRVP